MASQYPRGVQVSDVNASLVVTVQAPAAHVVAFGAAPVHSVPGFKWTTPGSGLSPYLSVVNKPILCNVPSDFTTQLGVSSVFGPGVVGSVNGTGQYGLAEVYDYMFVENNQGPLTAVNVFDPWSMSTKVNAATYTLANSLAQISGEVILASLVVTGIQSGHTGVQGVDYTYTYNDNSLQTGYVTVLSAGNLAADTSVSVSYYTPNLALITDTTIIGGTDVNGNYLGLEVLEHVFAVTGLVPAQVIAPGFGSHSAVIAAANAHVQSINNGRFRATFIGVIDPSTVTQYTGVNTQKNVIQNMTSTFENAFWPNVGLGGKKYHPDVVMAVTKQITCAKYDNIPYVSPSNKSVAMDSTAVISNGVWTPITIDPAQADYLELLGVGTFINFQGWKSLGDFTCAYPSDTNVQDMWINERDMFNWLGNSLSLTLAQFIDLAGNQQNLTIINETIQAFLNTLIQKGAANTATCSFNPNENSAAQVMAGIYTFHILWTPPTPIRTLDLLLQYDVNGLTAWISQVNVAST